MVLAAPDPEAWLRAHLPGPHGAEDVGEPPASTSTPVSVADLVADGASLLARLRDGLAAESVPPPAAATYLAGWFPGGVAGTVGYALALAGAAFLVEPAEVRWHLSAHGWPERVDLGRAPVVVPPDHPWAGRPEVEVDEPAAVVARAVGAIVAVADPLVDACHGLARVGRAGLWNEVADGLGMALSHQLDVPITPAITAVLEAAVDVPGVPWRLAPSLRFAATTFGTVHVAQKGGCCLAYTRPDEAWDEAAEADFFARFPHVPGERRYCSTCSFRDATDCDARQVWWLEEQHAERNASA